MSCHENGQCLTADGCSCECPRCYDRMTGMCRCAVCCGKKRHVKKGD